MPRPVRIRAVVPLGGFKVHLEFTDNTTKDMDLEPYLHGPIFEPIRHNPRLFRSVQVDPQMGTVVWENGADIDPGVLYRALTPTWMEKQSAQNRATHAG